MITANRVLIFNTKKGTKKLLSKTLENLELQIFLINDVSQIKETITGNHINHIFLDLSVLGNDAQKLAELGSTFPNLRINILIGDDPNGYSHIVSLTNKKNLYKYPEEIDQLILDLEHTNNLDGSTTTLSQSGMRYKQLYESALDGIVATDLEGNLIDFNESYRSMLGYPNEELKTKNFREFTPPNWNEIEKPIIEQIFNRGFSDLYEKEYIHKDGHIFPVELSAFLTKDPNGKPIGMWAFCRDISNRKDRERLLTRQLKEMTALHGIAQAGIIVEKIDTLLEKTTEILVDTLYSDNSGIVIYDAAKHWLNPHDSYHGLEDESFKAGNTADLGVTGRCVSTRSPQIVSDVTKDKDYLAFRSKTMSEIAVPILVNDVVFGVINAESFELDFFSEDDLNLLKSIANQLAVAIERIELLELQKKRTKEMRVLYETATSTGSVLDLKNLYTNLFNQIKEIFELDTFILVRKLQNDGSVRVDFAIEDGKYIQEWENTKFDSQSSGLIGWVVKEKKSLLCQDITAEKLPVKLQQTGKQTRSWLGVPLIIGGNVIGGISVQSFKPNQYSLNHQQLLESIAATVASAINNADLIKQTQRQIDQLAALHDIDMVINSSMDLQVTLNILLDQVIENLEVDAAAVLLLNSKESRLEFTAGRGFHTNEIREYSFIIDEKLSGKIAMEQHLVRALNLDGDENDPEYIEMMSKEGFKSFYSAPLIAKNQVKGMLDIFNRAQLNPDQDWFNFLETIAGQAAIAIDNASLLIDLNQTNIELVSTYDTTLEGWSRALDLRDRETEGHTQRVTNLTEKIAREAGIPEEDIIHIRRGALLHDIGKMGIPDAILHKPGPLTEKEWEIMRKHPIYAHDLLFPIEHLRPAITIPYCHHEKWDGSGYPRNLKGEEIPLPGRIFAIVDVWDALTSDRPYRAAWSEKKALDYIRKEKGSHFDPRIAEIFFKLVKNEIIKTID